MQGGRGRGKSDNFADSSVLCARTAARGGSDMFLSSSEEWTFVPVLFRSFPPYYKTKYRTQAASNRVFLTLIYFKVSGGVEKIRKHVKR